MKARNLLRSLLAYPLWLSVAVDMTALAAICFTLFALYGGLPGILTKEFPFSWRYTYLIVGAAFAIAAVVACSCIALREVRKRQLLCQGERGRTLQVSSNSPRWRLWSFDLTIGLLKRLASAQLLEVSYVFETRETQRVEGSRVLALGKNRAVSETEMQVFYDPADARRNCVVLAEPGCHAGRNSTGLAQHGSGSRPPTGGSGHRRWIVVLSVLALSVISTVVLVAISWSEAPMECRSQVPLVLIPASMVAVIYVLYTCMRAAWPLCTGILRGVDWPPDVALSPSSVEWLFRAAVALTVFLALVDATLLVCILSHE